jgi:hypothetical protein
VYSSDTLGLFCLLKGGDCQTHARQLTAANPDVSLLTRQFVWPRGSTIEYDVCAKKNKGVIFSVDQSPANRNHGTWPLMVGEVPGFERASEPWCGARSLDSDRKSLLRQSGHTR